MPVCMIPARGGSQRIPYKNRRMFHGKPIILYPIEFALSTKLFDEVWVSTDDPEIGTLAHKNGACLHLRDKSLAANDVGTQAVAKAFLEAMDEYQQDLMCVIYPCSPMVDFDSFMLGYAALGEHPYGYSVDQWGKDAGMWYWGRGEAFMQDISLSEGKRIPVPNACDINTELDWKRAEKMYGDTRLLGR